MSWHVERLRPEITRRGVQIADLGLNELILSLPFLVLKRIEVGEPVVTDRLETFAKRAKGATAATAIQPSSSLLVRSFLDRRLTGERRGWLARQRKASRAAIAESGEGIDTRRLRALDHLIIVNFVLDNRRVINSVLAILQIPLSLEVHRVHLVFELLLGLLLVQLVLLRNLLRLRLGLLLSLFLLRLRRQNASNNGSTEAQQGINELGALLFAGIGNNEIETDQHSGNQAVSDLAYDASVNATSNKPDRNGSARTLNQRSNDRPNQQPFHFSPLASCDTQGVDFP